jgi:hypothetical protein
MMMPKVIGSSVHPKAIHYPANAIIINLELLTPEITQATPFAYTAVQGIATSSTSERKADPVCDHDAIGKIHTKKIPHAVASRQHKIVAALLRSVVQNV